MSAPIIGTIYASTNKSCPGMLKIGKTLDTAQARASQTVTGSPWPMVPVSWFEFYVANDAELKRLEKYVHNHPCLKPHRQDLGGGREWFAITVEGFNAVLKHVQQIHTPTKDWLEQKAIGLAAWKAKQERERAERERQWAEQARIRAERERIEAAQRAERERIEAAQRAEEARISAEKDAKTKALTRKIGIIVCAAVLVLVGYDYTVAQPRRAREGAIAKVEQERIEAAQRIEQEQRAEAQRIEQEQQYVIAQREARNKRLADAVLLEELCLRKIMLLPSVISGTDAHLHEKKELNDEPWKKLNYELSPAHQPWLRKTVECSINDSGFVTVDATLGYTHIGNLPVSH